jgi:hypothetical protein
MNNYQSIINTFDIYGYRPHLFIGNYHRSGSFIGLIITFLSMFFTILISCYFISQLFDKKKVSNIYTIKGQNEKMIEIEVSKNTFYFTIELQDPYSYNAIMNEKIFYPKAYYKKAIRNNKSDLAFNWTIKELEISKCILSDFNDNYQNLFSNHPLNQTYCIKNLNESIFGTFQKEKYSFIYIELFECKNTTESKNCLPQEQIDYYLNGTFISIAYQEIVIDPCNYNMPNQPIIGEYYTTISHNYFKEIHMYFKEVEIITDKGILFNQKQSKKFSQLADVYDMISFKINSQNFAEISIKVYHKTDLYTRNYIDLENVIANIGGFVKFMSMIFYFLHYIFLQGGINEKIINKLFLIQNKTHFGNGNSIHIINHNNSNKSFGIMKKNVNINNPLNESSTVLQNKKIKKKSNENNENNNYVINLNTIKINESSGNRQITFSQNKYIANINNINQLNSKDILSPSRNKNYKFRNKKYKQLKIGYFDKLFLNCNLKYSNNNILLYIKGLNMIKSKLDMIYIISESYRYDLLKNLFLNENQVKILERLYKPELNHIELNRLNSINTIPDIIDKNGLEAYLAIKTNLFSYSEEERKNKTKLYDNFFVELVEKQYSL